jgi:hypothetical protein
MAGLIDIKRSTYRIKQDAPAGTHGVGAEFDVTNLQDGSVIGRFIAMPRVNGWEAFLAASGDLQELRSVAQSFIAEVTSGKLVIG